MTEIPIGTTARLTFTVEDQDLALALGSGDVPVLATPRMIAWLEAATVAAVADHLPGGATSVGTALTIEHLAASLPGTVVVATATVADVDGRTITFSCEAIATQQPDAGSVIGRGTITRAVVDRERFVQRLQPQMPVVPRG